MAILEGMAAGRPWIATSVGAIPMAVEDDQNGYLVPAENVDLLAERMGHLLRATADRKRMGSAGRRRTETEFSSKRMSDDYLRIYENVCTPSV